MTEYIVSPAHGDDWTDELNDVGGTFPNPIHVEMVDPWSTATFVLDIEEANQLITGLSNAITGLGEAVREALLPKEPGYYVSKRATLDTLNKYLVYELRDDGSWSVNGWKEPHADMLKKVKVWGGMHRISLS